jgi:PKD repeat protein
MEQEIIPNHQRASNILFILHEHLKKIIPEIPKTKIKKNAKSDWIRSIYHPTLEKNSRKVKRKVKALAIIALIFSGMCVGTYFYLSTFYIDTTFNASKFKVDVNEEITFSWNILGTFSRGIAVFGDGFSVDLNGTSDTVKHSYSVQGKYAPIIRVWNQYGVSISKSLCVEIKNYAPQFEVSVPNSAYEDELVRVSVVDLVESEVDLENGVIKYVYDFADNNQTTTSQNSIVHKWENAGAYPVTITLFDDQSALSQKTEYIEIINKAPEAYFDHIITDGIVESLGTICKRKFI